MLKIRNLIPKRFPNFHYYYSSKPENPPPSESDKEREPFGERAESINVHISKFREFYALGFAAIFGASGIHQQRIVLLIN
jgi:hypothetical protein